MIDTDLHLRYAPVLHFSRGENFFPMAVDEFLGYVMLYAKGARRPSIARGRVTPEDLLRTGAEETFLRSVEGGPLTGAEVAKEWGAATIRLVWAWTSRPAVAWTPSLARLAYRWFTEKTSAATRRFWWNDLVLGQLPAAAGGDHDQSDLPRLVLPEDMRRAAIDAYKNGPGAGRDYAYYYRTTRQGDYLNLQYWFFYAYNDWGNGYGGFNDHEGDWEGFHVFFKVDGGRLLEPPAYVCYLGHESRMTKPWAHPDVQKDGTHPVIYVAAGSHASYPEPKLYPLVELYNLVDYATGESFTLGHEGWRRRIPLETDDAAARALLDYRGSWGTRYWLPTSWLQLSLGPLARALPGEVVLPGVSAPRGPRFAGSGTERESWRSPLAFAGIGQHAA